MSRRLLRVVETLLLAAGFFLLGWWYHDWQETRAFQKQATSALERQREAASDLSKSPKTHHRRRTPPARTVLGRIEIPRLRIAGVIVQGTDKEVLDRAIGHFESTALPGEAGNVGLAGHRDTFLRGLGAIRPNDEVLISTPRSTLRYLVQRGSVVDPEQVDVLDPTARPTVTLVTCYPFHFIGPAPRRFVVRATLADSLHDSSTPAKSSKRG